MNDDKLLDLMDSLDDLRQAKTRLDEKIAKAQLRVLREFEKREAKAIELTASAGEIIIGTYVRAERVEYLLDKLKRKLTPLQFKRATRPVVVKEALESMVMSGEVTLEDVESCSVVKPSAPYIKVTRRTTE